MPMFRNIAEEVRRLPALREIHILVRIWAPRLTEIEQEEEEHRLEAMLHWHDPEERARTLRCHCHAHTLIDDNPASG
ncbi:MAG TPA: hypothetical protein VGG79_22765 [Roseiarcus sp.]|jgi:hypothetical protein